MVQGIPYSEWDFRAPAILLLAWFLGLAAFGCATTPAGPVSADDSVRFSLEAPGAAEVSLVIMNGTNSPMKAKLDRREAIWEGVVELPPGEYRYFFLVDGVVSFDPWAPRTESDDFGGKNGVVMVEKSASGNIRIY